MKWDGNFCSNYKPEPEPNWRSMYEAEHSARVKLLIDYEKLKEQYNNVCHIADYLEGRFS